MSKIRPLKNHIAVIIKVKSGKTKSKAFLIIFYIVGITGIIVPATRTLFIKLIPAALILNVAILAVFHRGRPEKAMLIAFPVIFLLSFVIEVIGAETGVIFGNYRYGEGLGLKVYNTPLIIGINWLMLVYMTASITRKYNIRVFPGIIIASLMMVIYDIVLEQVAPKMDMWYWEDNIVPLQNYAAWFILAMGFHSMFNLLKVNTKNSLAEAVFFYQFCFFLCLFIFFKIIK